MNGEYMATTLVCGTDDLKKDAELYANGNHIGMVKDLSKLKEGDTAILYTHGVWDQIQGKATATNRVMWKVGKKEKELDALGMRDELIYGKLKLPGDLKNLTLIVHACFSSGTVENPPASTARDSVFAGQLCAALKEFHFPGLRVIGYQGQSKTGRAGFSVDHGIETSRTSRRQEDSHKGEFWTVTFGGAGDSNGFLHQGKNVVWT